MTLRIFTRTHLLLPVALFSLLSCTAFAQSAASLSVEPSTSSPGASLPLSVSFQASGNQMAGLQFDVSYDSTALAVSVIPGAEIGRAAKTLYAADLSAGRKRIVIIGMNQTTLSDGAVLNLVLNISASAGAGVYHIVLDNVVGVSPSGSEVPVAGADATLTIAGERETGTAVTAQGVLNAATLAPGPVSPGEVITVFGAHIGPENPAGAILLSQGFIGTQIENVSAWFDGVPAPMLFAGFNQLNMVVPYEVDGRPTTHLVIQDGNSRTQPIPLSVAAVAPGIFTRDSTGAGQAVVLNEDGTLNSPLNPARAGSEIAMFATGGGRLRPNAATGQITVGAPGQLSVPAAVSFAGKDAGLPLYAGAAPDLVSGVIQVNVRIPADCPTGPAIPITLTLGGVSSREAAVISVR